ncbi:thiamine biosynthesis lipoprotein [Jatrophihabitans sp. GAS493]|nr:thiamine biosynthesis lipoprotein [Jatrophihabitans sp. GAS493]
MGTVFSLDLAADFDVTALAATMEWLHRMDDLFSTYQPQSQISRLDRGELGVAGCDPEVIEILDLCEQLRTQTAGYFDVRAGGSLDPSGVVKGWAIEGVHQRLVRAGSVRHYVNGGGDIRCTATADHPPWRFGIVDPLNSQRLLTAVAGRDFALATSGTAERGAHIVDPYTGRAADGLLSLSLVGADLTYIDAYATAAFAMGSKARAWLSGLTGVEAMGVSADGLRWSTSAFPSA